MIDAYDEWEEKNAADTETGNEFGTVTVAADGKTITATYEVDSFSPFIVYAFIEADEPEIKTLSATIVDGGDDVSTNPQTEATGADNTPDAILPDDKKTTVYIVQRGDTLWAISQKYGCTVAQIVALNGELITDPDLIFAGWEIKIP